MTLPRRSWENDVNICMIGAGYVGLVSAACFSEFGWTVTCVDKDPQRLAELNAGKSPIYEPGLDDLIERNMQAGRLRLHRRARAGGREADIVFLAVGTPMRRGDGYADLSYVYAAVEEIAPHLEGFTVIVTKSTVPVGTSREIERRLRAARPDGDFAVCSNPEFLREGSAIQDFTHPDRVLVGTDDERAREVMGRLYKPLALRNAPVMFVGRESAELAKYAANAFLALKISFINEIADLCEEVGADVQEVASAIGKDRRIGDKFLHPGPGYGGSCFPKDVSALIRTAREDKSPVSIIEQVQRVNDERKIAMAQAHREGGRRSRARQDHRHPRRHLQAEHRRHARRAEPRHRADAAGARRHRARLRSAGPQARRGAAAGRRLVRQRAGGGERRRRARRRHRVERVPRPRPQGGQAQMRGDVLVDLRNVFSGRPGARRRPALLGRRPQAGSQRRRSPAGTARIVARPHDDLHARRPRVVRWGRKLGVQAHGALAHHCQAAPMRDGQLQRPQGPPQHDRSREHAGGVARAGHGEISAEAKHG